MLQSYAAASQLVWASLLLWSAEHESLLHRCLQQSWCGNPRPQRGRGASPEDGECRTTGWVAVTLLWKQQCFWWGCKTEAGGDELVLHFCQFSSTVWLMRIMSFILNCKCIATFSFPEIFFLIFKASRVFSYCYFILLVGLLLALKIMQRSSIGSRKNKIWMLSLVGKDKKYRSIAEQWRGFCLFLYHDDSNSFSVYQHSCIYVFVRRQNKCGT